MKFIKKLEDYLKENTESSDLKSEIYKKREEIQNKISQIEAELNIANQTTEPTAETVESVEIGDVIITSEITTDKIVVDTNVVSNTSELQLQLESLKKELENLGLL